MSVWSEQLEQVSFTESLAAASPADWTHVVSRENSNLARVHGGALEPAILTAFQHQEHLSFPQLQLVLLTGSVREHCHIAR